MKKITMVLLLAALCSVGYADGNDDLYAKWYERGVARVEEGNLKDARECFRSALYYKPGDVNAQKGFEMADERILNAASTAQIASVAVVETASAAPVERAPKSDVPQDDFSIRVAFGSAPGIDEGDTDFLGTGTYPIEDDTGGQLEILAVKRFWSKSTPSIGGVFGGGVFF